MDKFKCLGAQVSRRGGVEEEVSWRVGEARKAAGTVKKLWKNGGLGMGAKKMLYEGIVVPTALYGSKAFLQSKNNFLFAQGSASHVCGESV